jgi:glycosyltransferase involved in cell wall biosynthesis
MLVMHLITRFNQGGTAQWLNYLVKGLETNGIGVVLVTGNTVHPEVEDEWLPEHEFRRIKTLSKRLSFKEDLLSFLEIRKLILELKPDVLNTHTSKAGVLGRLAVYTIRKTRRPYIVHTFHGHLLYGYFGGMGSWIVTLIELLISKFTDHFIVSGQRVAEELQQAKVISKDNFTCVTPGLPGREFPSRETSRREFDLNESDFVVGWLGRLTDIKDPGMLLEIATRLPDFTFSVGGEGELYNSLSLAAPTNVRMLGWVKQDLFWSSCDIAILTSKNEAQPYSLIEAIHAGKPIVARNVGSVQDVLSHGKYGLLFDNVEEAVACLKIIRGDSQQLEVMSEAAKWAALKDFSLDSFVKAHIAVYKKNSKGPGHVSKQ